MLFNYMTERTQTFALFQNIDMDREVICKTSQLNFIGLVTARPHLGPFRESKDHNSEF